MGESKTESLLTREEALEALSLTRTKLAEVSAARDIAVHDAKTVKKALADARQSAERATLAMKKAKSEAVTKSFSLRVAVYSTLAIFSSICTWVYFKVQPGNALHVAADKLDKLIRLTPFYEQAERVEANAFIVLMTNIGVFFAAALIFVSFSWLSQALSYGTKKGLKMLSKSTSGKGRMRGGSHAKRV